MSIGVELLRDGKYRDMWDRYCGFLDLSMEEFMAMQKHLLLEQLQLLRSCPMGQHLMLGATPTTVDEFRAQVPLTTYQDHAPFLKEQREAALPAKPVLWQRTTGNSRWAWPPAHLLCWWPCPSGLPWISFGSSFKSDPP